MESALQRSMYLNCHTWFSLRYGILKPEELLVLCTENGVKTIAHTDINNTSASLDLLRRAEIKNIKVITGIDFRNGAHQQYIGLAKNNEGFRELNDHLSEHLHSKEPFTLPAPEFKHCFIIYPFAHFVSAEKLSVDLLSENTFIGISSHDIPGLRISPLRNLLNKCVILETVTFRNKRDFNAHRLLRAIDNNTLLSKLPRSEEGQPFHKMKPEAELLADFEEFPEIIANTRDLMETCNVRFEFGTEKINKNQQCYTDTPENDYALLRKLAYEGITYRYPQATTPSSVITDRLEKELGIIHEKGFLSYFLINWDITSYARSKGYFYVGRGSGANSIIAYLLRITDVDPIELDLYFERFINLYRQNPPDFDIDFSWTDRDDITHYIFSRFKNVSLLAAYNTFQRRAVVRELGKVFGLPKHDIDILSDGKYRPDTLDSTSGLVVRYSDYIQEFPNILSIHAAGILISEKPLHYYSATFLPPKGYPTVQFDMVVAEDIGLYKFDILSQRGLAKIKDCLKIIEENKPNDPSIDIHDMTRFKSDERIKDLLRNARAIGCFYVESPAMRMLLTKLRVDDYLGLVAASSVIRPGVAQSGMMREFILRQRYPERRLDAPAVLLDIMPETYGVMVYQEDVIKVAHYFGGLDLAQADSLRRGMSGKFRGREEFNKAREAFFERAQASGHPTELVSEIWRQIESFAGYAFAKGHSASYAVESYQSLFLKAYYPIEYMTATINNFGGFYSTEIYIHEARMHGATIESPCVNRGKSEATLHGTHIILGFELIKDVAHDTIKLILEERGQQGPFQSLDDFLHRISVSLDQLSILVRIGAFRFTGRSKKDLLWEIYFRIGTSRMNIADQGLFETPVKNYQLPVLEHSWIEDAYDEMELLGFTLCNPFDLLEEIPANDIAAKDLPGHIGKVVTAVGYLVTVKAVTTSKGDRMYFGNFLDREGFFIDTVTFPGVAVLHPWKGKGIYAITGKVTEEFGAISIEVQHTTKLTLQADPRYAETRRTRPLNTAQNTVYKLR